MSKLIRVFPGLALLLSAGITAQAAAPVSKEKSNGLKRCDVKVADENGGGIDIGAIIDIIMKIIKMIGGAIPGGGNIPGSPLEVFGGGDQERLLPLFLSDEQMAQVRMIRSNAMKEAEPLILKAVVAEKAYREALQDPSVCQDQLKALFVESQKAQFALAMLVRQVDQSVKSLMSPEQLAKYRASERRIDRFAK